MKLSNKKLVTYTLYPLGLAFITYLLMKSWPEFSQKIPEANVSLLVLSTVTMLVHGLVGCWLFNKILHSYDAKVSYLETCKVYYLSLFAKYIPGVIWGFAMQASIIKSEKSMHKIVFANIRHMLFVIVFYLLACLAILLYREFILVSFIFLCLAYLSVYMISNLSFIYFIPKFLQKKISSVIGKQDYILPLTCNAIFLICVILLATYLLSMAAIVLAFYDFTYYQAFEIAVYQCLAWIVGAVAFVIPAGMGIREAAFITLGNLSQQLSSEQIQSISLITRLVQVLQDLFFSLLALAIVKISKQRK